MVHQRSPDSSDINNSSNMVPNIVVFESNGQEASVPPSKARLFPSESGSTHEPSITAEANSNVNGLQSQLRDGSNSPNSPVEEFIHPPTISYSLHITFKERALHTSVSGTVPSNDVSSYHRIEVLAEQQIKNSDAKYLEFRELNLRYGSCRIVGDGDFENTHTLTSQKDWRDVCHTLMDYWIFYRHQNLRLEIFREYFTLQTRGLDKDPFSLTKRREIHSLMKNSLSSSSRRFYISRIDLMRVTSMDDIRQIIQEDNSLRISHDEKEGFIRKVYERARKLFAICVLVQLKMRCLQKLLDDGLSDERLPLKEEQDHCHGDCDIDFRNLLDRQGSFISPEFNKVGEHQILDPCVVLPIHYQPREQIMKGGTDNKTGKRQISRSSSESTNKDNPEKEEAFCGSGSYSKVYCVKIDPDHHMLSQDRDSVFALKEFKDVRDGTDFKQEMRVLNELQKYPHNHIVTHLASWTHEKKDYMLFPCAQCNLRQYMEQTRFDVTNKECLLWFLEQLRGLAQALRNLHNFDDTRSPTPSSTLVAPDPVRKSGWHHDIKPENILYFQDIGAKHGTFRVTDFGSGKIQNYRSGSVNTRSPNGTLTYEPPEAKLEGATSRPYDVWSLGCVFLELLIWAVFDDEAVKSFANERVARRFPDSQIDEGKDDTFWQIKKDDKPIRRDAVERQIKNLRNEVLHGVAEPFKEVVELIERMLDINRSTRIIALDLWDTLNRIVEQKKVDLNRAKDSSTKISIDTKSIPLPRLSLQTPVRGNPEPSDPGSPYEDSQMLPATYLPSSGVPLSSAILQDATLEGQLTVSPIEIRSSRSSQHSRQSSVSESILSPSPVQPRILSWPASATHGSTSQNTGNTPDLTGGKD
ncbi:MAG: hypothetical protein Q9187_003854 [Circinaria calcarea]